jgi:hypothetical protein
MDAELKRLIAVYKKAIEEYAQWNQETDSGAIPRDIRGRVLDDTQHGAGQDILRYIRNNQ